MRRGDISHWKDIESCENLLFFAQLVNELLFDYSIPSNRISTLNSHYLCLDALSAINGIECHGVPEGTLKPIMEEFFSEVQKDPAFLGFSGNTHPKSYFVKIQDGKQRIVNDIKELNYSDLSRTAKSVAKVFFESNEYYTNIQEKIVDIIKQNDLTRQQELFRLTKSILTELMNAGYSLKYLYMVMNRVFWDNRYEVETTDKINDFFSAFDFEKHNYTVVFKAKKTKVLKFARFLDDLELLEKIESMSLDAVGKDFLMKKSDQCFIQIKREGLDPFDAAERARTLLEDNTAVYRLYDHEYRYKVWTTTCGVFDDKGKFFTDNTIIKAVQHTRMPSERYIKESMNVAGRAMSNVVNSGDIQDFLSLLSAIRFHSHSLDSFSEENQLLDLWAIFETILDISNKHTSDRIQQICIYLVPLLKRKYLFSLFDQLSSDIKNYSIDLYGRIVNDSVERKTIVHKVCEFVLLAENEEARRKELDLIDDFPLLKERIMYYREKMASPNSVHQFVEKHAERVKWQVMRIYRNRNLIIHNGDSMPYLRLLIENLHSYVDDFLTHTIHSFAKGNNIDSMCQEVFISECRWNENFSKSKTPITKEDIKMMLS